MAYFYFILISQQIHLYSISRRGVHCRLHSAKRLTFCESQLVFHHVPLQSHHVSLQVLPVAGKLHLCLLYLLLHLEEKGRALVNRCTAIC